MREHVQHHCRQDDCNVCRGGLTLCVVCGGAEASMPSECPGIKIDGHKLDLIQAGKLDYLGGCWMTIDDAPVAEGAKAPSIDQKILAEAMAVETNGNNHWLWVADASREATFAWRKALVYHAPLARHHAIEAIGNLLAFVKAIDGEAPADAAPATVPPQPSKETKMEKPHCGTIKNYAFLPLIYRDQVVIVVVGEPTPGRWIRTSPIVRVDAITAGDLIVETENSRYKLVDFNPATMARYARQLMHSTGWGAPFTLEAAEKLSGKSSTMSGAPSHG